MTFHEVPKEEVLGAFDSVDSQGNMWQLYFRFPQGFAVFWNNDPYICAAVGPISTGGKIKVGHTHLTPSSYFGEKDILYLIRQSDKIEKRDPQVDLWG